MLKRAAIKKSKNDLIHAEEGEDHFTDICSVGEYWLRIPPGSDLQLKHVHVPFLLSGSFAPKEKSLNLPKPKALQLHPLPLLPCYCMLRLQQSPNAWRYQLCWAPHGSAWNALIYANETQICQTLPLSLSCCEEDRKWTGIYSHLPLQSSVWICQEEWALGNAGRVPRLLILALVVEFSSF